jgi:hypothetical protein
MLQQMIVALVVPVALAYVVWSFLTMHRRQRVLDWLSARGIARAAAAAHRARLATPGCSNCAGGASEQTPRSARR